MHLFADDFISSACVHPNDVLTAFSPLLENSNRMQSVLIPDEIGAQPTQNTMCSDPRALQLRVGIRALRIPVNLITVRGVQEAWEPRPSV
eukprot:4865045-Pleurochrysis_carterae.AAC.1